MTIRLISLLSLLLFFSPPMDAFSHDLSPENLQSSIRQHDNRHDDTGAVGMKFLNSMQTICLQEDHCIRTASLIKMVVMPANYAQGTIEKLLHSLTVLQEPTSKPIKLASGSFGRIVEDLQRTLNAKLKPTPNLAVDGDFGPATKAAVIRFQKNHKLPADGTFDQDDWTALGTLLTESKPVAAPAVINREKLTKKRADPLDGVPFVTAKSWAMANLADGTIHFHSNKDEKLDIASTTKIMTAYLVLQQAAQNEAILAEKINFSERADRTPGSTSSVRAGEILTVKELLYGLLLPSGNDAAVALAEHFGPRLAKSNEKKSSYDLFILAMNDKATSLGMQDSHFKNPHGLTAPGHRSTAADLVKLATAAMKLESFRHYVQTRQHGCTVASKSGSQRNILWKNTNQLLAIDGYIGIKTGTTSAAGACLVSACQRDGKEMVLVVLGSGSSRGRYADSRNLYRWGWKQILKK